MREIKFRALTQEGKVVYEVRVIEFYKDGTIYINNETIPVKQLIQYTGLPDKNGKKIYEADILKMQKFTPYLKEQFGGDLFQVEWDEEKGWFNGIPIDLKEGDIETCPDPDEWKTYCEVIGNIYENPELLESTVVEFKAKSIGGIAVENIEAIPHIHGIVKKTYQEKK